MTFRFENQSNNEKSLHNRNRKNSQEPRFEYLKPSSKSHTNNKVVHHKNHNNSQEPSIMQIVDLKTTQLTRFHACHKLKEEMK
jgi:hypothetical protein